jgi:hypothetical protein
MLKLPYALCGTEKNLKPRSSSKYIMFISNQLIPDARQDKLRPRHFKHFSVVENGNWASNERKKIKAQLNLRNVVSYYFLESCI